MIPAMGRHAVAVAAMAIAAHLFRKATLFRATAGMETVAVARAVAMAIAAEAKAAKTDRAANEG